ncbi:MAG: hypothetical protein WCG77_01280 [Actinomycetes bacterium]
MPTYGAPALTSAGWYSEAEALGLAGSAASEGWAGGDIDAALGETDDVLEFGSDVLAQPAKSMGAAAAVTHDVKILTRTP